MIIGEYEQLCMMVFEANAEAQCYLPALTIVGQDVELDGLMNGGSKGRAFVFMQNGVLYKIKAHLEPKLSPVI